LFRKKIALAAFGPSKSDVQCLHRWQKVLDPRLVKGPWKPEEDELIQRLVQQHGAKKWSVIAAALPGRIGKQCRERWHNREKHNTRTARVLHAQRADAHGGSSTPLVRFNSMATRL